MAKTRSAAHRKWVRGHRCCVPGCRDQNIICAHVRTGTGGGMGLKPGDEWCISLCNDHHHEQHWIGERAFERRYGIDMKAIAKAMALHSPELKQ